MGRKPKESSPSVSIQKEWSRPRLLDVEGRDPKMHYRWVRKRDIGARRTMGYTVSTNPNLVGINTDGGSALNTHDMVLMEIPVEKAKALKEFASERAKKLAATVEKEGTRDSYEKSLQELGYRGRIDGVKTIAEVKEGDESLEESED